jgi:hypothetical protein
VTRKATPRHVELATLLAPAAEGHAGFGAVDAGLLGDAVDHAARRTAAIQHRSRAFDHFDLFDIGKVAEVQRVIAHAIDELVGNRGKAADGHLVALAVAVRQAHARNAFYSVFHRAHAFVAQQFLRHHVHSLRNVAQRRVDLGGAGSGARIVSGVTGCSNGDGGEGGVFCECGEMRQCQRNGKRQRGFVQRHAIS